MTDLLDELAERWKRKPDDPDLTIDLCARLRGSVRTTLIQQVGQTAMQRHGSNVPVLLAVARMYLMTQRLGEAQSVLVAAGRVAPREKDVYRLLGEVLLRRGDADRAEKVFERAVAFGATDDDTKLWLERARVYKPMQSKAGTRAVAAEVARSMPLAADPPVRGPMESMGEEDTRVRDRAPSAAPPAPAPKLPPLPMPPALPTSPTASRAPSASSAFAPHERRYSPTAETASAFDPRSLTSGLEDEGVTIGAKELNLPPVQRPLELPAKTEGKAAVPHPQDVLDALALAGIFEPQAGGAVQWERAAPQKRRGTIPLIALTVLFVGSTVGALLYVRNQRERQHQQAEVILTQVDAELRSSQPAVLPETERKFSQAFDLDSRSQHAAESWLHERALSGLLRGGNDIAFQEALERAREVKVPEERLAHAQVASFLFQGDTVGAAALLSKFDGPSASDPWYQLLAGAALERAGDTRCRERYQAAVRLDPELVAAQVALARAEAIDGDHATAAQLAKDFRAKYPDRVEGAALIALAWARDYTRETTPPPEVAETVAKAEQLPLGLRFVPHALAATEAIDKRDQATAKAAIQKGLSVVDSPGVATWLGLLAIETGDEGLARQAALAAVAFSVVYPPGRVLAARVALLGARLDEALKATEELEAASADVAVVRAAVAYERVDANALGGALEAVPVEARKQPFLAALILAQDALGGHSELAGEELVEAAGDPAPWSDLVAMDIALDQGDLESARKIADGWKGTEERPLRAVRLARLARYEEKLDDADRLSLAALQGGTVTPRVLGERVLTLVARGKGAEVGPLLAKYPLVLGPLAAWLGAYAKASDGKVDDARAKVAQLDPPPTQAPVPVRTIATVALGAMRDRRRGPDAVKDLVSSDVRNPDVLAAAKALGLAVPPPKKRPAKKK
jgi:predicted Zn-dependent protease